VIDKFAAYQPGAPRVRAIRTDVNGLECTNRVVKFPAHAPTPNTKELVQLMFEPAG